MSFDAPLYLWLLFPVLAAFGGFFFWAWREKRRLIALFVSARLLPSLTLGVAPERQKLRMGLLLGAIGLLLLALARPQFGFSWEEARSRGLDIVVAIDTSRSMLATDVAPNRLRRAQLAALDLKRLARADRLGLVAFAGGAFLQCPLTLDDEAFRQSVETLDVTVIPQGGTALAEAILAAKGAFKEGNENHKVLVIFTDGEDHDGQAAETAKEAARDGMRVFTIGVGTPNGDVLRTVDASGRSEFVKDAEGNAVKSRLNEALLQEIAEATGGFYRQLAGANTMNVLYDYGLAPLPKSELSSQKIKRHHERFQWLLGLAIVLLLAEMLVPERKEARRVPAVTGGAAKAALLALMLSAPCAALAGPGKALKQYGAGKFEAAQLEYERALKSKPNDPRLHFNAGAAAFQSKDYDTAIDHLNSALLSQDVALQQRAYYNLGNARFRQGEDAAKPDEKKTHWEQAVRNYESALKLDAKDFDARHNLEFVKQRLEELKQQQQQQKDDKSQQQDQKDQNKDQKDQQQKQDQQKQDDQKQHEKDKQQGQDQQQKQDEQKKPEEQQASKPDKKEGEDKQGQQASPDQNKEEGEEEQDGAPQAMKMLKMTPQQAMQLLDTLKAEEKNFPLKPILRTNRLDRVFKDW